ncbi:hypothetical protein CKA32_002795 [Geitlerinema sp. FC II]|nr:hypothetical protein CKA32_002795 [Geitlerinema sp. FC II]
MRQKGNRERETGNQIFSGVLIFDDPFGTAIVKDKKIFCKTA